MKKIIFSTVITGLFLFVFISANGEKLSLKPYLKQAYVYSDSIDYAIKSIEIKATKDYISANDESGCIKSIEPVTVKFADYLNTKYTDFDIRNDVKDYPLEVAMMGVFQLLKEKNYPSDYGINGHMRAASGSFDCFSAALGGLLGINEINSLYHDFTHGVTPRTVFRTMKTMLRRVAGGITIAWTVVELAICLFD